MLREDTRNLDNDAEPSPATEPQAGPVLRWWEPALAWSLAALILLLFVPNILTKLNPVTGDEPSYLMTTISLIHDHDLDESNNYAENDYWQFAPTCQEMNRPHWGMVGEKPIYNVPGVIAPGLRPDCGQDYGLSGLPDHFSKGTRPAGSYTKHGIGLSVLIAPAYALGGRPLVVVFLVGLTALLGVNIWLLAFETTGRRRVAWITWLLMLFCAPIICYAFLIFPATPAALLVIYSWRRLRLSARAQQFEQPDWQPNTPFHALLIGLCIGVLPWLHSLYLSLSLLLVVYWLAGGRLARWWRGPRTFSWRIAPAGWSRLRTAALLGPILISAIYFVAYYVWLYGSPLPNTQDHAGFAPLYDLPANGLGLLFDQKYGLLMYAPFYLLAGVGLWIMRRRHWDDEETAARRSDLAWLLAVSLPYLLLITDYNQWWGEWCPPARYLMPTLPLLAIPLSTALAELEGRFFKIFAWVAGGWGLAMATMFMYNPHLMYNWQNAKPATSLSWIEANLPFLDAANLGRLFPYYVSNLAINNQKPSWLAALVWLGLAGLAVFGLVRARFKYEQTESDSFLPRLDDQSTELFEA